MSPSVVSGEIVGVRVSRTAKRTWIEVRLGDRRYRGNANVLGWAPELEAGTIGPGDTVDIWLDRSGKMLGLYPVRYPGSRTHKEKGEGDGI